jgi:ubiquinol-cytochrome c reductase iron-sulfur subunit
MNASIDYGRRRLLVVATSTLGIVGLAFAAVPFIESWKPSARARALGSPIPVDASKLEVGQMLKAIWRGQPVFVIRRSASVIAQLATHDALLADPASAESQQPAYIAASGPIRARTAEYWVGLAVCTHLGCTPLGAFEPDGEYQLSGVDLGRGWPGGFYCPCHGSKYDISGRVFKSQPAPRNLTVPPYTIDQDARVVIGADAT